MIKTLIKKYSVLTQFSKFVVIGFINTAIDFTVLNLLVWQTGIYKGRWIILLNVIAFTTAVINSYFWNKFWIFHLSVNVDNKTFNSTPQKTKTKEFSQFIIVSLIGAAINSYVVYNLTTFMPPFLDLSERLWVNFVKVTATGVSLIWNFLTYKFIVFRKNKNTY